MELFNEVSTPDELAKRIAFLASKLEDPVYSPHMSLVTEEGGVFWDAKEDLPPQVGEWRTIFDSTADDSCLWMGRHTRTGEKRVIMAQEQTQIVFSVEEIADDSLQ